MSKSLDRLLAWLPAESADRELARQVNPERLPRHVAIIMDGNGRWAGKRHLPRVEGHRAGIDAVRAVVETSARLGLDVLTLYAFFGRELEAARRRSEHADAAAEAVSAV